MKSFYQREQSLGLQCRKLVIQFPISISQDGYSSSVWRTVYNVSIAGEDTKPQVTSATIPLDGLFMLEQWDFSKSISEQSRKGGFKDSGFRQWTIRNLRDRQGWFGSNSNTKRSNERDSTRLLDKRRHIFKDMDRNAGLQPASSPCAVERRSENSETLGLCSDQFSLASLSSRYPILSTGSLALDVNALRVSARVTLDNENIELRLPTTSRLTSADLPS